MGKERCLLVGGRFPGAARSALKKKDSSAKNTCRSRCPLWGPRWMTPCTASLQLFRRCFFRSPAAHKPFRNCNTFNFLRQMEEKFPSVAPTPNTIHKDRARSAGQGSIYSLHFSKFTFSQAPAKTMTEFTTL